MADETTVPASLFARNLKRYSERAQAGDIVNVTNHGRVVGGYLSVSELEHFKCLKRREREILIVGKLQDDAIDAIAAAEYDTGPT